MLHFLPLTPRPVVKVALSLQDDGEPGNEPGVPVRRALIPLSRRLHQVCMATAAEVLESGDLTPAEFGSLNWLEETPDLDQNGLAARLGIDRSSASSLVFSLEEKGLIERRVNPTDRRARLLRLTEKGAELRARFRPAALAAEARLLSALQPDEREQLKDMLFRVISANEKYMRPGAGRRKPRGGRVQ